MFGDVGRYFRMKAKGELPHIEVTEEEFIRLMLEAGQDQKEAEMQAKLAKGLGSSVMIGDKMVSIKENV